MRKADDLEALHEPNQYLYLFKYSPPALRATNAEVTEDSGSIDEYLDVLNWRILDEIQLTAIPFVRSPSIHDRTVVRLSVCKHRTTPADIDRTFETRREIARQEDRQLREEFDVEA